MFWTTEKLRHVGVSDEQIASARSARNQLRALGLAKHAVMTRLGELHPLAIVEVVCAEDYQ